MENLPYMALLAFALITFLGSTSQVAAGFGYSVIVGPFQLLFLPPVLALQLLLLNGLVLSILNLSRPPWTILPQVAIGAAVGATFGTLVIPFLGEGLIVFWTPAFALATVALLLVQNSRFSGDFSATETASVKVTAGALSGLGAAWTGIPGPPLMAYFILSKHSRETVIGTAAAIFVVSYASALIASLISSGPQSALGQNFILILPALLAGAGLGAIIRSRVKSDYVKPILIFVLIGASLSALSLYIGGVNA